MIVVLILTSIVVGLAFSVLSLVQRHLSSIQNNSNQKTELIKLEASLWLDFNRFPKLKYNDFNNELKFYSRVDSIRYSFKKKYIIRREDTFRVAIQRKLFYFNGKIIQNGQLDAIKLEDTIKSQNHTLFIYKKNDASLYLN